MCIWVYILNSPSIVMTIKKLTALFKNNVCIIVMSIRGMVSFCNHYYIVLFYFQLQLFLCFIVFSFAIICFFYCVFI